MKLKASLLVIIAGFVLTVLLYTAPHKPPGIKGVEVYGPKEITSSDDAMQKALEIIKSGNNPMEGILMLRDIAEKDPTNTEVLYQLAFFSIQSGQTEKAIERLKQIEAIDSNKTDVLYYMAGIYEEQEKYENALHYYKKFHLLNTDEALKGDIDKKINTLTLKLKKDAKR